MLPTRGSVGDTLFLALQNFLTFFFLRRGHNNKSGDMLNTTGGGVNGGGFEVLCVLLVHSKAREFNTPLTGSPMQQQM